MSFSITPTPAVFCVQDGARLHYVIPRALASLGWLEGVGTDFFVRSGSMEALITKLSSISGSLGANRMRERHCPEIENRVISFPLRSLWWRRHRKGFSTDEDYYEWLSKMTAQWLLKQNLSGVNMVHGFVRNLDPDFCRKCRKRGLWMIGDQMIAPAVIEMKEMESQRLQWPGWSEVPHPKQQRLVELEEKTWQQLDHITCASHYVREGLEACGVASEQISVLPYPAPQQIPFELPKVRFNAKLRVGFVGSVNLRKGAPVFAEMARRIKGANVEFVMVGPVSVPPAAVKILTQHVSLVGPVPRSQVGEHLRSFDVFLFPSVCEGSASVVMEALNAGLPVVTTPNSGTVVRHGIEGFVHTPYDLNGIEASLRLLLENEVLRETQAEAGRLRALEYDLASYSEGLREVLPGLLEGKNKRGAGLSGPE